MVVAILRQQRHFDHESERLGEIGENEIARNRAAAYGAIAPHRQAGEQFTREPGIESVHVPSSLKTVATARWRGAPWRGIPRTRCAGSLGVRTAPARSPCRRPRETCGARHWIG